MCETHAVAFSLAEERDYQQVLNICGDGAYDGLDYIGAFFRRWLREPGRLVFIGRIRDRVVALESVLLVDGGQTVVVQGLRVAPDLRGRGIAGVIQRHVIAHVRQHYPEVRVVRMTRKDAPPPETLTTYRVIAKEAILSLCCEAVHLAAFVAELRSKLAADGESSPPPLTLSQRQAETLVLTPHVVSTLLPGRTIISNWEPLGPLEANLEVLRRRGLTWIADRESRPDALGLGTPPYAVPYRHDAALVNINIYGRRLASVCAVFLAQLDALPPGLPGYLVFYAFVDPEVWTGLRRFCRNDAGVSFFKDYFDMSVLETNI